MSPARVRLLGAWHCEDAEAVARAFEVDVGRGLTEEVARARLREHGANEITETAARSPLRMFLGQLSDFMILVLIAAAIVSGAAGEPIDAIAIGVIVLLNAIVGAVQEYRAERAIAALKRMSAPDARVRRDGRSRTLPAGELVPGDIALLEAGNVVPADLRLVECFDLEIDEAALTGESLAVSKTAEATAARDAALGERASSAYKGTLVTRGRAVGICVATGMKSELGRIAELLQAEGAIRTPLQKRLARFGKRLAWAVLAICALIFAAGLLRGEPALLMFLTAVSLAVAAIPEALPAVVTVSLALGARKMSRHNALVRNLPAVETLGSVTFICADKTGTLTQNRMQVEGVVGGGRHHARLPEALADRPLWRLFGWAMALDNDVVVEGVGDAARPVGDPTEIALYREAQRAGFDKARLAQQLPRVAELPFDADRKRMTTLHRHGERVLAFTKGAPEAVLAGCSEALSDAGPEPLDAAAVRARAEELAGRGHRVLAFAVRELPEVPASLTAGDVERDAALIGLVALLDPPRDEAAAAVADCLTAGITPVMITGDHAGTALAIAERLGMAPPGGRVMTGEELEVLPLAAFEDQVEQLRVYARVSPHQKTKIVQALQDRGQFVAMTGDGVNDAPALKRADIGVAMGRKGTDVAREASDMVLLDDDFATIVAAVREGRRIFDNIRKFIRYTMTSNAGEIGTLFLAPFLGLPIPLLPIHILWINLVTDGLPGLALAMEPAEPGIMQRRPRAPDESIFGGGMWQYMVWVGLLIAGLSILSQAWAWNGGADHWQTVVFTVLTFSQLVHVHVVRSELRSVFSIGVFSNAYLFSAVLLTVGLQLAVIYVPVLNGIFKTAPLSLAELAICCALSLFVLVAVEIQKLAMRASRRAAAA